MASLISLCNQALAQIAAGSIADLDEGTIESRECKRFAEPLLAEMADWTEWHFLNTRVSLAPVANGRDAEWLYAYAAPADIGSAMAIREVAEAADILPIAGPYNFPWQEGETVPYLVEGGVIYTNVEDATLVYHRATLTVNDLTPLMQRAFVLELAARIALPIKKDAKIAATLAEQAEMARSRAIADEENKSPRRQTRYISEAEYARWGYGV